METPEEEALIRSFVVERKRERLALLLANEKRRKRATSSLAHFRDLDPRWIVTLPPDQHDAANVERALRSRGAGDTCYLVSESRELDARRMPLRSALEAVVGFGMGTLISCIPGKLAFYEGEGPSDRHLLHRVRLGHSD